MTDLEDRLATSGLRASPDTLDARVHRTLDLAALRSERRPSRFLRPLPVMLALAVAFVLGLLVPRGVLRPDHASAERVQPVIVEVDMPASLFGVSDKPSEPGHPWVATAIEDLHVAGRDDSTIKGSLL